MKPISACLGGILLLAGLLASAQQAKPGMLSAEELKKTVPSSYFFRGQSGAVQLRNSAGFRGQDAKLVLAGFVDTSGYAADLAEKYQGFLITEVKLDIEGAELAPGQYGFGFTKGGKFVVMDVGSNDLLSVSSKRDEDLKRPVPLKMVEDDGVYKLYAGKSWVSLKVK